jgi:hypothetical protein
MTTLSAVLVLLAGRRRRHWYAALTAGMGRD